tara:strand:+ start:110 stop:514 length:405 start_codon:yes stop_codon:yes gene_type:complete
MSNERKTSKTMRMLLWITKGLLAVTFMWAGFMKIFHPHDLPFPWVKDNTYLVLITGIVDLLGGFGIVLPTLLGIKPKLSIFAAYGIIVLMTFATVFHISRGEAKDIGFNIFMALLAIFVVWGGQIKAPITPKKQ